jgi:hypothetical protein
MHIKCKSENAKSRDYLEDLGVDVSKKDTRKV